MELKSIILERTQNPQDIPHCWTVIHKDHIDISFNPSLFYCIAVKTSTQLLKL
jgi:hypothetical protein